jgi:GT2 family glycosyltransferase
VLYGKAWHIDETGKFLEEYPTQPRNFELLKETCFISQPAVFFRRRVVQQWGYLNESLQYCMDYEYWLRLGMNGARFCYLEEVLASTRLYFDTKTMGQRLAVHAEINDMLRHHLSAVPERWLFNYAHIWLSERGVEREDAPALFLTLLVLVSLYAAFRWNGLPSVRMLQTLARWVVASRGGK